MKPTKEEIAAALLRLQPSMPGDFYSQVMGNGINAPSMQAVNPPPNPMPQGAPMAGPAAPPSPMGQSSPVQAPPMPPQMPPPQMQAGAGMAAPALVQPTMDPAQVAPVPHPAPMTEAYVIKKGDTLSELAQKFGTTVKALAAKNGIRNPNMIVAGKTLKL